MVQRKPGHTHTHVALKVFDFSTSPWVDESSFMVWGFLTSNVPAIVLLLLEWLNPSTVSGCFLKICHLHANPFLCFIRFSIHNSNGSPARIKTANWGRASYSSSTAGVNLWAFICLSSLSGDKHTCGIKVYKTQEEALFLFLQKGINLDHGQNVWMDGYQPQKQTRHVLWTFFFFFLLTPKELKTH